MLGARRTRFGELGHHEEISCVRAAAGGFRPYLLLFGVCLVVPALVATGLLLWQDSWRDGVYDFLHFYAATHETLGIACGRVTGQFGGLKGRNLTLAGGDVVVLVDMITFAAERLMEIEVGALTGAGHGEKSPMRTRAA